MCITLKIIQKLVVSSDLVGPALVPFFRQLLPMFNVFKIKNCEFIRVIIFRFTIIKDIYIYNGFSLKCIFPSGKLMNDVFIMAGSGSFHSTLYRVISRMINVSISNSANRRPMHILGPNPKGKYTKGCVSLAAGHPFRSFSSRSQRSGRNAFPWGK